MIGLSENDFAGEEVTLVFQKAAVRITYVRSHEICYYDACSSHYLLSFHESRYERWNKEMYLFKYYFFKLLEKMTKNSQCGCQSPLFIHKRSSMDSSTDSFITVAQIWVVIYLCIVNPLSSGIGLCTSNINKERFLLESAHYRKFLSLTFSIVSLLPLALSPSSLLSRYTNYGLLFDSFPNNWIVPKSWGGNRRDCCFLSSGFSDTQGDDCQIKHGIIIIYFFVSQVH